MKILLIRPAHHNLWEPLSLLYLAGYVRRYDPELKIKVLDEAFDGFKTIHKEAEDSDYVCLTASTPMLKRALQLASLVKVINPRAKTILGGYGPSLQPLKCMVPQVDHVVVGEGEEALRKIIAQETFDRFVSMDHIVDLDSIPWPARDLVDMDHYIGTAEREEGRRVTSVVSERGCIFRCSFCGEGYGRGGDKACWTPEGIIRQPAGVRFRSPAQVVYEMIMIREKYRIKYFKFSDAETNPTRAHFMNLCKQLVLVRWDTPWSCNMRVDKVDDELCRWAAKARCDQFDMGVESGSKRILRSYHKGITPDMTKRAFKSAKRHGIKCRAQIILGAPLEDYVTIRETDQLLQEIDPDRVAFTILAPYPGTKYYSDQEYGEVDWTNVDNYGNTFWRSNYLTNEQLRSEQARLMSKYRDRLPPIVAKKKRLGIIKDG